MGEGTYKFARGWDDIPTNRAGPGSRGPRVTGICAVLRAILAEATGPLTVYQIAAILFTRHEGAKRKYRGHEARIRTLLRSIDIEHLPGGFVRLKGKP